MKNDKPKRYKVNNFYYYANKLKQQMIPEEKIEMQDFTEIFYYELEQIIAKGELLNMNISAPVREGKSTIGIQIGKEVFELLKKYNYRKEGETFGIKNICRNQQEYSKMMRDPTTQFTVLVVDESDALEETTGEGVTAENALRKLFSDVQAARYVHKINIAPKDIVDTGSNILLSVVGKNKEERITHCKIYYRIYEGGMETIQLLGHVNIKVGDLIKNWEDNVKKHFVKPNRTKEDETTIKEWRKKDFYVEYVIRKMEKMELLTKHGIFRPRLLDTAEIVIEAVNELSPLTKLDTLLENNIIRNVIRSKLREKKIVTSLISEEMCTRETIGVLDLYKGIHKVRKLKAKILDENEKGKIGREEAQIKLDQTKELENRLNKALTDTLNEYEKYKKINEEYNKIESE